MSDFPTGTVSVLARCVSAEIRARLAAASPRMTHRDLARAAGWNTHNYVSKRLRDEAPFTLDDIERIAEVLMPDDDPIDLIKTAWERQLEGVWQAQDVALRAAAEEDRKAAMVIDEVLKRGRVEGGRDVREAAREAHEAELNPSGEEPGEQGHTA